MKKPVAGDRLERGVGTGFLGHRFHPEVSPFSVGDWTQCAARKCSASHVGTRDSAEQTVDTCTCRGENDSIFLPPAYYAAARLRHTGPVIGKRNSSHDFSSASNRNEGP